MALHLATVAVAAPPTAAERLYTVGVKLAAEKRHAEAARAFEEAFRIEPNHAYLYNAGASWEWAGDLVSAHRVFEKFAAFSDSPGRIAEVKEKLRALEARLARTHAKVTVEVEPAGAILLLDEDAAPLDAPLVRWLPLGAHTVTAKKADHETRREAFTVMAGEPKSLRITLSAIVPSGRVEVRTEPAGARVWLDDADAGASPVNLERVPAGAHVLRAEAPDREPVTREIAVERGSDLRVALTLAPVARDPRPIPVPPPTRSVSVTGKWWFWTSIGAAVVGGTVLAVVLALPRTETESPPPPRLTSTIGGAP